MSGDIASKDFGLPPRIVLEQVDSNTVAIVIKRKSRIIMADGRKIVAQAEKIQKSRPEVNVALKTTAPVCSKTKKFLTDEGIQVISADR
ncbi:MAG: hypothetical protein OEM01_13165 [Desulfobulbaceae bacterium]|nr:hypothetical protein [Desulfobulbaceae bacterium]